MLSRCLVPALLHRFGVSEIPLSFTVPLEDVTVWKDETVTLTCEFTKPGQKVNWLKNGKALSIKEKARMKITADGNKHTLVIPKSEVADTAEFTCSLNGVKTKAKVTVKGRVHHCGSLIKLNKYIHFMVFVRLLFHWTSLFLLAVCFLFISPPIM